MIEEIVDIYNENFEHLGTATKTEARLEGHWVRSIHIWIIRPSGDGFVLFQKRGANKKVFPNTLDISVAGHYVAGESVSDGIREISEELNVEVAYDDLIPLGIKIDIGKLKDFKVREFCYTYLLVLDEKPEDYVLSVDEVEGLVELSIEDGLNLFSGKVEEVQAKGIEFNNANNQFENISIKVSANDFIPRIDPYYYKVFILAKRYLNGERELAI